MLSILALLVFIYFFWFFRVARRVFVHTYLWQIKEYRWDRMKSHIREGGILSSKSLPSVISAILAFFGYLLSKFIGCRPLYLVMLVGFAYYVYSTLVSLTQLLGKKLIHPRKSLRNFLIVGTILLLSTFPIILTCMFYDALSFEPSAQPREVSEIELIRIFPEKTEEGLFIIPLETAAIVLFFLNIFVFDLAIPLLVAVMVAITAPFSSLLRKKK